MNPFLDARVPGVPVPGVPRGMSGFDANPFLAAPPNPQPAEDEAGAWESFLTTLVEDQNLQQSLIKAGSAMLQPRAPGTGRAGLGAIGRGMATGVDTYNQGVDRDAARAAAARDSARADARLDLQGEQVEQGAERNRLTARQLDQAGAAQESEEALAGKKQALQEKLAESLINLREAQAAVAGGVNKPSGEAQQTALRLLDMWKEEGIVEQMGGEGVALTAALQFANSMKNGKPPAEFQLEVQETFDNMRMLTPKSDRDRLRAIDEQEQQLLDSYRETFQDPAEPYRGAAPVDEATVASARQSWLASQNAGMPATQFLAAVESRFGRASPEYRAATKVIQANE